MKHLKTVSFGMAIVGWIISGVTVRYIETESHAMLSLYGFMISFSSASFITALSLRDLEKITEKYESLVKYYLEHSETLYDLVDRLFKLNAEHALARAQEIINKQKMENQDEINI